MKFCIFNLSAAKRTKDIFVHPSTNIGFADFRGNKEIHRINTCQNLENGHKIVLQIKV